MTSRKKQALITGALTSSAGIFISKALGLLYVAPFVVMATDANSGYYAAAYSLYDTLLNISAAGIPFAVAALVAKYYSREDYKTVILVRKLSMGILLVNGFIMGIALLLFAGQYASFTSAADATADSIMKYRNVLMILSLALFLVPYLSSYRGFYQGLKDMKAYAVSQVLEQFTRVGALLLLGAICVYVFKMDGIWAVYMAILSAGLAAFISILYFKNLDRFEYREIRRLAKQQESAGKEQSVLLREIVAYGLPFLLVAFLGNSMNIVNMLYFERTIKGVTPELASTLYSIIHLQCNKLTSIPQVLAIGFGASLVPYITVAYEKRDLKELRKNILDCLNSVLYIALPLCFCLLILSRPIYYVMYGSSNLDYGAEVLAFSSFLALTGTISPILSNILLSLKQRRAVVVFLTCIFIIKVVSFFPLMNYTGYTGAITSSIIAGFVMILLSLWFLSKKFNVSFQLLNKRLIQMGVGLVAMYGSFVLLRLVGIDLACSSRLFTVFQLAICGIVGFVVYFITTAFFQLPQIIFKTNMSSLFKKLIRR